MKINPKKAALIGMAASTLFSMSGCSVFDTPDVYGPPNTAEETITPDNNIQYEEYGPAYEEEETMSPDDNQNEDVYGPPDMVEPSDNEPTTVYGPPEMFDDDAEN